MDRGQFIYTNLPLMLISSKQKKPKTAWWPFGMSWVLLFVFTWNTNGFIVFTHIAKSFLAGDLTSVRNLGSTSMVPVAIAIIVVMIPVMIAVAKILEKRVSLQTDDDLYAASPERQFAVVMTGLLREELFARFLFLGLMTKIPKLDGTGFYYLFALAGNSLWSLIHLKNFEQDRKWIMVLPQFVGGIFLTMIYTSHGFFAALCTHVVYDMVVFSASCRIRFTPSRLLLSCYHLITLGVYSLLFFRVKNHSLSDIKLAVENKVTDWGFIDYFSLVGMLAASSSLLLEVLWYDLEQMYTRREYLLNPVYTVLLMALACPAVLLMNDFFSENLLVITVGLAIFITFLECSKSGSGIARLFWKSLLLTLAIQIIHDKDWRTVFFVLLLFLMNQLGERAIRYIYPLWLLPVCLDIYWNAFYFGVQSGLSPREAIRINREFVREVPKRVKAAQMDMKKRF